METRQITSLIAIAVLTLPGLVLAQYVGPEDQDYEKMLSEKLLPGKLKTGLAKRMPGQPSRQEAASQVACAIAFAFACAIASWRARSRLARALVSKADAQMNGKTKVDCFRQGVSLWRNDVS